MANSNRLRGERMESKLNLNQELVDQARQSAGKVAADVQGFIDLHTTVTVERSICRLLGDRKSVV